MSYFLKLMLISFISLQLLASCSMQQKIGKQANKQLLTHAEILPAHIGISIYDPSAQRFLYNHQADKLFVPASNTKIFTCYAALKNLGDSLVGIRYIDKGNGTVAIKGNADASFLMTDFTSHPVFDFLKKQQRILISNRHWKEKELGRGWTWEDYRSDYIAERSALPAKGNLFLKNRFDASTDLAAAFDHNGQSALLRFLQDSLQTKVEAGANFSALSGERIVKLYSQPTDSLLRIMMHRSDNFFAEETLLMISNERLGYMNDSKIIDTLLKTDFKGMPQQPQWVDGSGLSRYNLITPQDFVWVLDQMKNQFKWERIRSIFATGGEGTLGSYYKNYGGKIYAKTGTLSNHVALSGYLFTNKGRPLIFSVLVNAHEGSATGIRRAVEQFLTGLIDRY